MAITIAFINQKGGCGKSSSCFHLSGAVAYAGYRVLLVDADPQGSLTQGFFGAGQAETLSQHETLAALFDENALPPAPGDLIVPTGVEQISIVRSNQLLAPYNQPSPEKSGMAQHALSYFLQDVEAMGEFDIVLIDCPPNLYQCSWNALVAAQFVVIPVPPEDFGTQGLRVVHQAIENARLLNPRLHLLGHLISRYDGRLLLHQSYSEKLRKLYGTQVLSTVVPEASAFKVSLTCREPVSHYEPSSKAARAICDVGAEVFDRASAANQEQRERVA
jgi:chromosome partitioning protein